jgi:Ca2+-binding EF-hand superfamily protein
MIHRLCDRPHAALKCLVAAVEVEVEARNSSVDQALTHLNLSAVLSSLNRHRDSLGHANIAVKLLSRCVKKKNGIPAEKNDNEEEDSATTSSKAAEKRVASLLTMAHYNAGVEREYLKHRASSLVSYRSALKMAQDQLPKDHPVIKSIASGIFDASTNSVESYKLPTPPTGSPRSMNGGPRADRIALNHLGLRGDTDANIINQPFSKSPRSKLIATNHKKKHKKIKRYGSLEEEIVAKFKSATKHGRTIHGHKIETIEDIFIAIDEDGGGSLDRDEFKKGLNRLSIFLSPNAVDKLMKEFLLDGHEEGNEITFNGFMAVMNRKFDKKHLNTSHSHHIASRKSFSSASLKKAEHKRKKEALRFSLLNNSENQQSKAEMEIKTIKNIPLEKYVDLNQFPDLVNNALHSLFQEFDTNSSGHITFKEVKAMLLILPERTNLQDSGMDNKFDDEDAGRIMLAFDADGNGEIEEEEFSNWIKTGLSRSKEEREHFSQTGTLAKKLSIFLDSMECLIQNIISPDITQFKVA